jgi:hypothetical protein
MNDDTEVIAIFLDGGAEPSDPESIDFTDTSCLLRDAGGGVTVQPTPSAEILKLGTENSGIFKKGTPIVDPVTGDVIGYELEEDERFRAAVG